MTSYSVLFEIPHADCVYVISVVCNSWWTLMICCSNTCIIIVVCFIIFCGSSMEELISHYFWELFYCAETLKYSCWCVFIYAKACPFCKEKVVSRVFPHADVGRTTSMSEEWQLCPSMSHLYVQAMLGNHRMHGSTTKTLDEKCRGVKAMQAYTSFSHKEASFVWTKFGVSKCTLWMVHKTT